MEEKKKAIEAFYHRCSDMLGTEDTYVEHHPYWRRTRWTDRKPGSGRFPGFGTIRMFSPDCIHVALSKPISVTRTFNSAEAVYAFLESVLAESSAPIS